MKLSANDLSMLKGEQGQARQQAMQQIIGVGEFFDAKDLVDVKHVHIMADGEALGESGVVWLEELANFPEAGRRVRVPTITDPRGADFSAFEKIKQPKKYVELEKRMDNAFRAMGVLMTNTCINYQGVMPPTRGQHLAFGDTGSVIYANSVCGARSNFEGGPSAIASALTGRAARYGFHLEEKRRGNCLFHIRIEPKSLSDWGALGAIIGKRMKSYWDVPVITGLPVTPGSDELKHFGAALASFGSTAMFHMVGVTPEAPDTKSVFDGPRPVPEEITRDDLQRLYDSYKIENDKLDVVVFAGPQLSIFELQTLAGLLDEKHIHKDTTLIAATSPEIKSAADRFGITERIEGSGAIILSGVCFYQMHAREIGEINGWRTLMTNSAKLSNIIGGYGYTPVLGNMERCVESAVAGKILK